MSYPIPWLPTQTSSSRHTTIVILVRLRGGRTWLTTGSFCEVSDNSPAKTNRLWVRRFTRLYWDNKHWKLYYNPLTNLCLKACHMFVGTPSVPVVLYHQICQMRVWKWNEWKNIVISQLDGRWGIERSVTSRYHGTESFIRLSVSHKQITLSFYLSVYCGPPISNNES